MSAIFGTLPFSLCALLVMWLFARASRALLARRERAAADLVEDAKALLLRDEPDRLRSLLASQRTPFASALQAAVDRAQLAQQDDPGPGLPILLAREVRRGDSAYTLVCLTGVFLLLVSLLYVLFAVARSSLRPSEAGSAVVASLPLALATALALRAAFAIDRLRAAAVARMVPWLEEVSELIRRGSFPPTTS